MSNKTVTWITNLNDLSEIYQPTNMKFSFANIINNKIYQCHQWVKCKDYLHDAVRTTLTGKKSNIYGFKFTKNDIQVDLNNIRLLVAQPEQPNTKWFELRRTFTKSLKYINYFESLIGEKLSKIEKVKGNETYKHVWMFIGPKFWLTAPYFVSLYAFLIRIGAQEINKKDTINIFNIIDNNIINNDIYSLKQIKWYIKKIINNRYNIEEYINDFASSYYTEIPINNFHDRMGIVSLCNRNTPVQSINDNFNNYILKETE